MSQRFGKFSFARKRSRTDVVGLDIGCSTIRAVRLKRTGDSVTLIAADLLPRRVFAEIDAEKSRPAPLILPKNLRGLHAAVSVTTPQTCLRYFSIPGGAEGLAQINFNELLGLAEGVDYRVGYEVLFSDGREQNILAAAIPEKQARWVLSLLPQGIPAPCSLQAGGAAVLNCFARELSAHHGDAPTIFVHVGGEVTDIASFYKGRLVLFRQCLLGSASIIKAIQDRFGLEEELIPGILDDDLIDVTPAIQEAIDPFLRQLLLTREFVERKRSCHIETLLLSGAVLGMKHWNSAISRAMDLVPATWNPFGTIPSLPDALNERAKGIESRFSKAIGAALAALEMDSDLPR